MADTSTMSKADVVSLALDYYRRFPEPMEGVERVISLVNHYADLHSIPAGEVEEMRRTALAIFLKS